MMSNLVQRHIVYKQFLPTVPGKARRTDSNSAKNTHHPFHSHHCQVQYQHDNPLTNKTNWPSWQTQHQVVWTREWCVFDFTGSKCCGQTMWSPLTLWLPAATHFWWLSAW